MREPSRKTMLLWSTLVIVLALLSAGVTVAAPPVKEVKVGTDCWQTQDGTEQTIATIPANFFCRGSKAISKAHIEFKGKPLDPKEVKERCACPDRVDTKITWTDRHGNEITDPNKMVHAVTQHVDESTKVDTCVRRTTTAKFTKKNEVVKVNLQLIALSLESKAPIQVTCGDGAKKEFAVFVTQSARQPAGSQMTFTPKSLNANQADGDVKLQSLRISYDVEFKPTAGGTSLWMRGRPLKLVNTPGTFTALFP
jgi:hypothetical protein